MAPLERQATIHRAKGKETMPTIRRTDAKLPRDQVSSRRRLALLALGMSVLLPACQREGDNADAQANLPAGTQAESASVTQSPTAADASVSSQIAAKRRTLVADAVSALRETEAAVQLLAAAKASDAIAALERATGKLDIVLAADPDLALAPVDVRAIVHDVIAAPDAVTALRQRAEAALDDGRLQDARHMIADLASEHVISVTSIPLATYPAAIKQAAALIHADKPAEAAAALETALSTLVVEDTIIPLPLVRAEALHDSARPLAEKPQRTAGENDRLRRLLDAARLQIELAQALGYATKDDLEALSDELKTIRRKTEGQGFATGLFDRIKRLFEKAKSDAIKPRAAG